MKRIFRLSLVDPQHIPPKCCTLDYIQLKHVEKLFNTDFKMQWNRKYEEHSTIERVYCPTPSCGEWIMPQEGSHDHKDASRNYNLCTHCKTKICTECNGKWHRGTRCVIDRSTSRFIRWAKREGLRKCYNCRMMVQTEDGLNHAIWSAFSQSGCRLCAKADSRCAAEFCMACGAMWKQCQCPVTANQVEHDRLSHMSVPEEGE